MSAGQDKTGEHIPQGSPGTLGEREADPGRVEENKEGQPDLKPIQPDSKKEGAFLNSAFVILAQTGGTCATDRHPTSAVAQQTSVWCWAASGEGVTSFHREALIGKDLRQCNAVSELKATGRKQDDGTPYCCAEANYYDAACSQNGWTDEIFDTFMIDYRWLEGPLSKGQIHTQICQNGPFTYSIEYAGGYGGHTFVVKDYRYDENQEMYLYIDSHEYFTSEDGTRYPAGFKRVPYAQYAAGWYAGVENPIDFTYVQIVPLRSD
jgi:hypothetical protein